MDWIGIIPNFADFYGFVYEIENISKQKKYIGYKALFYTRKTKIGKREKKATKTRKTYKYVKKESNWREYTGSNKELNKDIENGDIYIKTILKFCKTKKECTYWEQYYQFCNNVLLTNNYYNENISGKYFPKDLQN